MADVTELFGADGPLAANIDGFATREEQVSMAQAVMTALSQREHTLIEAGTGVGKTFAYLVPALFSRRRIVVSTGTRTLQDQLFHRDLPILARAVGLPVRVALLKGRSNYLCLHRLDLAEREATATRSRNALRLLAKVRRWSHTTVQGDIGEIGDLNEHESIWQAVTSTRENCLGGECPMFQRCHVVAARREAQAADVIVVNHHLLMADILLKERGFGDLLPGVDAVIVDEAHQLPETATQFLGANISSRHLQHLVRDLSLELQAHRIDDDPLSSAIRLLENVTADAHTALQRMQGERLDAEAWPADFVDALHELAQCAKTIGDRLVELVEGATGLEQLAGRVTELALRFGLVTAETGEVARDGVRWVQRTQYGFVVFYAPINVASQLSRLIAEHSATWIFTSATLAVGADFSHYARRIGLVDARRWHFGSPFDYAEQALLYLPKNLSAPGSPLHTREVIEAAIPVLQSSGGRAFMLFTSHRALKAGAAHFRATMGPDCPFPILVQGEAPRELLLQQFRAAGNAVLFGTSSFWEGVDVKGPALTVVIIDKLPFGAPDDPILKARVRLIEENGGNAFVEEQIPDAVIALKQGVGRLIRDVDDFGVVMLCDSRVTTRSYGRIFLNSLPPMPRTHSLLETQFFLEQRLGALGIFAAVASL